MADCGDLGGCGDCGSCDCGSCDCDCGDCDCDCDCDGCCSDMRDCCHGCFNCLTCFLCSDAVEDCLNTNCATFFTSTKSSVPSGRPQPDPVVAQQMTRYAEPPEEVAVTADVSPPSYEEAMSGYPSDGVVTSQPGYTSDLPMTQI